MHAQAPEVCACPQKRRVAENKDVAHLSYGPAADVWSLGILAYEMLTGSAPLQAPDVHAQVPARRGGSDGAIPPAHAAPVPVVGSGATAAQLAFPPHVSAAARAFVVDALRPHARDRPRAADLLVDGWLSAAAWRAGIAGAPHMQLPCIHPAPRTEPCRGGGAAASGAPPLSLSPLPSDSDSPVMYPDVLPLSRLSSDCGSPVNSEPPPLAAGGGGAPGGERPPSPPPRRRALHMLSPACSLGPLDPCAWPAGHAGPSSGEDAGEAIRPCPGDSSDGMPATHESKHSRGARAGHGRAVSVERAVHEPDRDGGNGGLCVAGLASKLAKRSEGAEQPDSSWHGADQDTCGHHDGEERGGGVCTERAVRAVGAGIDNLPVRELDALIAQLSAAKARAEERCGAAMAGR